MKVKKLVFALLIITFSNSIGQYVFDRVNESGFTGSQIYFNSQYLNPYGMFAVKDVSLGIFDDPYLNLYLNPGIIPNNRDKSFRFYIDFRGDREEKENYYDYPVPLYPPESSYYVPNPPAYYSPVKNEPEALISLGIILNPISKLKEKFYLAGTYQIIRNDGKYYDSEGPIYYPSYDYDPFGNRLGGTYYFPYNDFRYYGTDELFTEAHLYSFYSGYQITDDLGAGIGISGITHEKTANFGEAQNPQYENDNSYSFSDFFRDKGSDYSHLDYSIGLNYNLPENSNIGLKFGYLDGKVNQFSEYLNEYDFSDSYAQTDSSRYRNSGYSLNNQVWERDGKTVYGGLNFSRIFEGDKKIKFYYKYSNTNVDLKNSSAILDTNIYSSIWYDEYENILYESRGKSFLADTRKGTGELINNKHEAFISFQWQISDKVNFSTGFFYLAENEKINSFEPVDLTINSQHFENMIPPDKPVNREYESREVKNLEWTSETKFWRLQIPFIFRIKFDEYWGMMIGISKILNTWKLSDNTTADFDLMYRNNNGDITERTNFTEKYYRPDLKLTNDATKVIAGFNVNVSETIEARLMIEPGFEESFRIAQWWLAFSAGL